MIDKKKNFMDGFSKRTNPTFMKTVKMQNQLSSVKKNANLFKMSDLSGFLKHRPYFQTLHTDKVVFRKL